MNKDELTNLIDELNILLNTYTTIQEHNIIKSCIKLCNERINKIDEAEEYNKLKNLLKFKVINLI